MAEESADDVLAQFFIAFGHGVGSLRVPRETVAALRRRYAAAIAERMLATWDADAPQVLERVRAIGRAAALAATQAGRTTVTVEDFEEAAVLVERESRTPICPVAPPA